MTSSTLPDRVLLPPFLRIFRNIYTRFTLVVVREDDARHRRAQRFQLFSYVFRLPGNIVNVSPLLQQNVVHAGVILAVVLSANGFAVAAPRSMQPYQRGGVPIISQVASDRAIERYSVPLKMSVSVHKWIFSFHRGMSGHVRYKAPANVVFDGKGVPAKFRSLFGQLGTPLTWSRIYRLHVVKRDRVNGGYCVVAGVPRKRSQVERVVIKDTPSSPILATWYLQGGWTINGAIQEQHQRKYLLPKHAALDISGHGYKIHTDMLYGRYAVVTRPSTSPG